MGRIRLFGFVIVLVIAFAATGAAIAGDSGEEEEKGAVSQAVYKAQAEGLKGQDIAEAAHKAIAERKKAPKKVKKAKKEYHDMHSHGLGARHGGGKRGK